MVRAVALKRGELGLKSWLFHFPAVRPWTGDLHLSEPPLAHLLKVAQLASGRSGTWGHLAENLPCHHCHSIFLALLGGPAHDV